ncbi:TPA: acetate kinase [Candidatus Ventrenecus stercoripullorum]|nr:acetate kinase [Candidatus Ventrenecus stercoripullorum]
MMKILSVNAGSSSLKFTAYEMPEEKKLISGYFERIGIHGSFYTIKLNGEKIRKEVDLPSHTVAFEYLIQELLEHHIVESLDEIKGIGHRVVQGADHYDKSVIATDEVVEDIDSLSSLAPLHNPAAVLGIKAAKEVVPDATEVVVFDTAFHQTMPEENYLYALPRNWYTDLHVRRYGAHGTSHKYIAEYMAKKLGRDDLKLIICHVGSGCSVSAVKNGKCVNTSMGFTPTGGLVMGTRCGDIDPSILPFVMEQLNISPQEMNHILNKESGVLALSGQYSDMRDIYDKVKEGDSTCTLTLTIFIKRIVNYIAQYYFELEGCDAIVFTAGVLENGAFERSWIADRLQFLGVELDREFNEKIASYHDIHEGRITTDNSTIPIYVVPTDEEVMIARDTYHYVD